MEIGPGFSGNYGEKCVADPDAPGSAATARLPGEREGPPPAAVRARAQPISASTPLARRFEAAVFDWEGTAVPDSRAPAPRLRRLVEALSGLGFDMGIVSDTGVDDVDGRLQARPGGPGELYICLNRGSEVYAVGPTGPTIVQRRVASAEEEAGLTRAAELAVEHLRSRGVKAELGAPGLNRRRIDLIAEPGSRKPPKARLGELVTAVQKRLGSLGVDGLAEVLQIARSAAAEAGLADARVTSDAEHVAIGLTDKADSARWLFRRLWLRGIGPRTVMLVGDELGPLGGVPGSDSLMLVPEATGAIVVSVGLEPLGVPDGVIALDGGPSAFLELLRDQLERRERGALPVLAGEPGWTLRIDGLDPELERVHESLLTLADGRIGTTGNPLAAHPAADPTVFASGLYRGEGPETTLLECPVWTELPCGFGSSDHLRRALDLRAGFVRQDLDLASRGPLSALTLSSLARPGSAVLRATGASELLGSDGPLDLPAPNAGRQKRERGRVRSVQLEASTGGLAVAASEKLTQAGAGGRLDRLAAFLADPLEMPEPEQARRELARLEQAGFERLFAEHRRAWAERWEDADVAIEGDPELQLAVRFCLFQLMASADDTGEAAVGARGLSGPAYRGHVFWDSDVFVLPFLAATHPEAARAMLEYRLRRLPTAQDAAEAVGRAGARFPWESAGRGSDVTPRRAYDRHGRLIAIRTGALEEHIVADVAWAASCYLDWTGDEEFLARPAQTLFAETARYWASRIRLDASGRGHIYGVIGPDEYHEAVDDNAYTNVMARWNLRRAAELVVDVEEGERARWGAIADSLVDGYDPERGLYEQFAGFWKLEPLVLAELAPRRPIAADLLLGRERVEGAQVVKQADALMLHHLVPDELEPGSLVPDLQFYEPRTAHGSSLSPGIHAALFARAGMIDKALDGLRLASRIDLDDLTGTTAGGLHLGAMGSVWQALALGLAGLRPRGGALGLDPVLPERWSALELRVRFRASRVRVRIAPRTLEIAAEPRAAIALAGAPRALVAPPGGLRLEHRNDRWEVHP